MLKSLKAKLAILTSRYLYIGIIVTVIIYQYWFEIFYNLFAFIAAVSLYSYYQYYFINKPILKEHSTFFPTVEHSRQVSRTGKASRVYPVTTRQARIDSIIIPSFKKIINNPEMENVMNEILFNVNRDYIQTWYKNISRNNSFPRNIDNLLHYAVIELIYRFQTVDISQWILSRLLNIVTAHLKEVQNAVRLLRASGIQSKDPASVERLLAQHYCQGKLHPALTATAVNTSETELVWLRKRIKPIVPLLLSKKDASNPMVFVLVRELLLNTLLKPLITSFSDPDYWNQTFGWIAELFLDQNQSHLYKKPKEYIPDPSESPFNYGDVPTFEAFLKRIENVEVLAEAMKMKQTIDLEISRQQNGIAGCNPDDIINGRKVSKTQAYINNLIQAQKKIDKTLHKLQLKSRKSRGDLLEVEGVKDPLFMQVLADQSLCKFFIAYLDDFGYLSLYLFCSEAFSLYEHSAIEKLITSLEDSLDTLDSEWDWLTVAIEIRTLWEKYLVADSASSIAKFLSSSVLESIQKYISTLNYRDQYDPFNSIPPEVTRDGLKSCLVAVYEIMSILNIEHFPNFLKSAQGKKMLARYSTIKKKGKSPERLSTEFDRPADIDEYDVDPQKKKGLGLFEQFFKSTLRRISRVGKPDEPKMSLHPRAQSDVVEQELQNIIFNDDTFKRKKQRPASFFSDFSRAFERDLQKDGNSKSIEDLQQEKTSFFSRMRPKSHDGKANARSKDNINDTLFGSSGDIAALSSTEDLKNGLVQAEIKPPLETDADSFIQLEMDDNTPASLDENLTLSIPTEGLPPMIILPAKYFEVELNIQKLKKDAEEIEKQIKDADSADLLHKQLQYAKRGISYEIAELETEKQKIEKSQIENIIMPDCITAKIDGSQIIEQEGKGYAVYPIQVSKTNSEGVTSGWMVARRYSQFLALHQSLKAKFPVIMQNYELPGKLLAGIMKKRTIVLESRREAFEKYLTHVEICTFITFRKFICHPDIVKFFDDKNELQVKKSFLQTVYHTVDDTMDTILLRRAKSPSNPLGFDPTFMDKKLDMSDSLTSDNQSSNAEPLVDLFIELFELKGLRRQAVVIFLQQLFGDTVERKATEAIRDTLSPERILRILVSVRDTYWPNGKLAESFTARTQSQRIATMTDTSQKISILFPELFGGMVGRQNARRGASRWHLLFQNPRLNQHLMYKIFDEILSALFPK
ncbi:Intermediate filament protein [Terramyces sp. JEL0728]|nr:Intermediate filament protein [Terramyces sp. JEL0728]